LPEYAEFGGIIKVIDVPTSFDGSYANVIADAQTGKQSATWENEPVLRANLMDYHRDRSFGKRYNDLIK